MFLKLRLTTKTLAYVCVLWFMCAMKSILNRIVDQRGVEPLSKIYTYKKSLRRFGGLDVLTPAILNSDYL